MLLCSALLPAPFWVLIAALALEALTVPLPGLLFREKALICLLSYFLSFLTLPVLAAAASCVSFLFQEEMAFHFCMSSECPGWACLHAGLWSSVMWRQIPRVLFYEVS